MKFTKTIPPVPARNVTYDVSGGAREFMKHKNQIDVCAKLGSKPSLKCLLCGYSFKLEDKLYLASEKKNGGTVICSRCADKCNNGN